MKISQAKKKKNDEKLQRLDDRIKSPLNQFWLVFIY